MIDNTALLHQLLSQGLINIEQAIFRMDSPTPLPEERDFKRVEGMLLGLAIGEALCNTTESQLPTRRRQLHGEIQDYLTN